jgi:hypothetical protein
VGEVGSSLIVQAEHLQRSLETTPAIISPLLKYKVADALQADLDPDQTHTRMSIEMGAGPGDRFNSTGPSHFE